MALPAASAGCKAAWRNTLRWMPGCGPTKPGRLTVRQAAALPLVFITAWEGLVDRANVRSGHKVLVHGGAGGVGHVAVQLARARGAEVFATGTAAQAGYIRSLGATPIDHETTSVEAYVNAFTDGKGFDIVYDTVGGRC